MTSEQFAISKTDKQQLTKDNQYKVKINSPITTVVINGIKTTKTNIRITTNVWRQILAVQTNDKSGVNKSDYNSLSEWLIMLTKLTG